MSFFCRPNETGKPYDWRLAKILAWIILVLLCILAVAISPLIKSYGIGNVIHAVINCPLRSLEDSEASYGTCLGQYLR